MIKVLDCLTQEHDFRFVVLAALVSVAGCWIALKLYLRTRRSGEDQRLGWIFLSAVAAGSAVWTTHFIAMLGFETLAPHGYAPFLTLLSWFIAISAASIAFWIAISPWRYAAIAGGAVFGAGVGAMHYTGMSALLISGTIQWDPQLVALSFAFGMTLGAAGLYLLPKDSNFRAHAAATIVLALAITSLHFTGMSAMTIVPDPTIPVTHGLIERGYLAIAILAIMLVVVGMIVAAQSIDWQSERSALARYRHLALHDVLTALPNRSQAAKVVTNWLEQAKCSGEKVAVIGIDLNRFKDVNDVYGHTTGDALLKQLAERLGTSLGDDEFVARIGGDEFLAAKICKTDDGDLLQFARRLVTLLSAPVNHDNTILNVGASCGIAIYPDDGSTTGDLILRADLAMYRAKSLNGENVCRYSEEMDEQARHRSQLALALKSAVEKNELALYYQPQTVVATGALVGFEALLRWNNPQRGFIPPADFIPIAEATGMIVPIGEWVLETACRHAMHWPDNVSVAVNVSPMQFNRSDFAKTVRECLVKSGLKPSRLELEITETILISDSEHVVHVLRQLKALGVRIAMDDFGTGYSSLSTLQAFPFDKLKIDRSVTCNLDTSEQAATIVRAVIGLSKSLSIPVLAEGVENAQHLAFLQAAQCDEAQGFAIGAPMPEQALSEFLADRAGRDSKQRSNVAKLAIAS